MKTPDLDQVKQNDPAYKKDTIMDSVKKGNLGDAKDKISSTKMAENLKDGMKENLNAAKETIKDKGVNAMKKPIINAVKPKPGMFSMILAVGGAAGAYYYWNYMRNTPKTSQTSFSGSEKSPKVEKGKDYLREQDKITYKEEGQKKYI